MQVRSNRIPRTGGAHDTPGERFQRANAHLISNVAGFRDIRRCLIARDAEVACRGDPNARIVHRGDEPTNRSRVKSNRGI